MNDTDSMEALAAMIQAAVAPVFLLAGIAGLLAVLSTRLGRITDRARIIERRIPEARDPDRQRLVYAEAESLWKRIWIINWAIRLCVSGALSICLTIVALFVGELVEFDISSAVAILFVIAMLFVISGLVLLLREVGIATGRMRLGMETTLSELPAEDPGPAPRRADDFEP